MAEMNVSLPDAMKDWVDARAREKHFDDAGDYVRELIKRDRDRAQAIAKLQHLIDEGLDGGVSDRSFDDVLAEARAEADALGLT